MTATVELGSISTGTLRTEDLLSAFADELERIAREHAPHPVALNPDIMAHVNEARALLERDPDEWTSKEQDAAEWLVHEDLYDALNEYAPPCCYFGAHPGDGADFGYWPSDDAIRDGVHDGDIIRCETSPEYLLEVNDHGNETLYRVRLEEVWSVV